MGVPKDPYRGLEARQRAYKGGCELFKENASHKLGDDFTSVDVLESPTSTVVMKSPTITKLLSENKKPNTAWGKFLRLFKA